MFEEGNVSSNAVVTYAVGTLKVKHVVIMGHYGCGGIAVSMAPLPEGYAERWLGHTTLPSLPSSPFSSSHSPPPSCSSSPHSTTPSSASSSVSSSSASGQGETLSAPKETPADLAVQRWILPIRKIYETSGRPEIRQHRERLQRLFSSPSWSERIARVLMGAERAVASDATRQTEGSEYGKGEASGKGESGIGEKGGIGEVTLHDGAFRALVEENVKANVWRLGRSR
ncbi:hypothetical protein D9611_012608 [Ephemerocybe angulata]|uniref:Carbonic anhydrase n=1 Tax=Ephemerocybe angulata TaxID=980116 RepID=A0A8H5AUR2_9AGAR|nr:hypothetical protein D9611_012608 [Tulosesus angulatus]